MEGRKAEKKKKVEHQHRTEEGINIGYDRGRMEGQKEGTSRGSTQTKGGLI